MQQHQTGLPVSLPAVPAGQVPGGMNDSMNGTPQGVPGFSLGQAGGGGVPMPGMPPAGLPVSPSTAVPGMFPQPAESRPDVGGLAPGIAAAAAAGAPMTPAPAGTPEEVALRVQQLVEYYAQNPLQLATEFAQLKARYLAEHYQIVPSTGDK